MPHSTIPTRRRGQRCGWGICSCHLPRTPRTRAGIRRGSVPVMAPKDVWEEVYKRFDPEQPADRQTRADRGDHSPAAAICKALDKPFADPRELLLGTVGTGKTTELLRIAEARETKEVVVFLDLQRHFAEVARDAPA